MKQAKPNSILMFLQSHPTLCSRCRETFHPHFQRWKIEGARALSLYEYGNGLRTAIYQFKGCGDYELRTIFVENVRFWIKKRFSDYIVVPAPSYPEHDLARGFNHVCAIFECLELPLVKAIVKTKNVKQSDLSKNDRAKISRALALPNPRLVKGKKVLFVDDVYTTGSTAKACVRLLQKAGASKIQVLVIAKTPKKEQI